MIEEAETRRAHRAAHRGGARRSLAALRATRARARLLRLSRFRAERVTERGRWLADLHVDRPLLVGEAIGRGLFASLDAPRAAGLMAALAADAERDYGELELDDALVTALARVRRIAYKVATVEWQQGLEPAPEINFSAAATAARWAAGMEWAELVRRRAPKRATSCACFRARANRSCRSPD